MLDLVLLGRVDLTDAEGRTLTALVQQPKRLALLTYLALSRSAFVRRDELLGLFWAESDEVRARTALRQAVYFLRRLLGSDVVAGRGGEELGISEGSIRCDALAFEIALTRGDLHGALELYRGELLPGFYLDGCPGWQEWLDRERTRLSTLATAAAWELSQRAETAGNQLASVQWARRARECSPFDETGLRQLMRLLARAGDRTSALREYEHFADWTRQSFGDEPDPESIALVAEIRSLEPEAVEVVTRPANAEAGVEESPTEPPPARPADVPGASPVADEHGTVEPDRPQVPSTAGPRPEHRRWRIPAWGAAAVALLLCGAVVMHVRGRHAALGADPVRIAVLPFQEFGRPASGLASLGAALTASVTNQLAQVPSFEVVSGEGPGPVGEDTGRANRAGRAPGARVLLTGTIFTSEKGVCVRYALVDAGSGTITRADTVEVPAGDLIPIVEDLSLRITSAVRKELGLERRRSIWRADGSSRGTARLLEEAAWQRERATALQQAEAVPAALRALGAADSLLALASLREPRSATLPVLRAEVSERVGWLYILNPDLPAQRSSWARGIHFATSALALDPQDAHAWEMRGVLRYMLWGTSVAEARPRPALLDSARRDLQKATMLDHALPRSWSILSAILSTQGHLAEAAEAAAQALASDHYLEDAQEILLRLYTTSLDLARDSDAVHWCAEIRQRYQGSSAAAHCTLGILAWSDVPLDLPAADVWSIIREVDEPPIVMREVRPELEMLAAAVLARRGERDSAFAVIRRAKSEVAGAAPSPLLRFEALARATAGDRAGAEALIADYARLSPSGVVRLRQSRALRSFVRYGDRR